MPEVAQTLTLAARVDDGVLTIRLPAFLGIENRRLLIRAVERERRPYVRIHLDATHLMSLDSAGMGALARVARLSLDHTSMPPILISPTCSALLLLGSIGLLVMFEVRHSA